MSTLHERLLTVIDREACKECPDWSTDAVRAVVHLHARVLCFWPCSLQHEHYACRQCKASVEELLANEPCKTIQAIAEALGVEIGGVP